MDFDRFAVAERGRKIYERHRRKLETEHPDWFVAIDVKTERLFLGDSLQAVHRDTQQAEATGLGSGPFHFVHIGHAAMYRSTRSPWRRRAAG
jgi:hypothetical protein